MVKVKSTAQNAMRTMSNALKPILQISGIVAKGIRALRLMADGCTCREIGEQMGTNDKTVAVWMSKARKYLRSAPALLEYKNIS